MRQVARGQRHGKSSWPSPLHVVQHPRSVVRDAARCPGPGDLAAICLAHLARCLENLRVPRLFAWPQDSEDERALECLAGLKCWQELRLNGGGDLALSHVARIENLARPYFEGGNATDEGLRSEPVEAGRPSRRAAVLKNNRWLLPRAGLADGRNGCTAAREQR